MTGTRCLDCRAPCPQSLCRLRIEAPLPRAAKLAAAVLHRSGFEVAYRRSLSQLARKRLGVDAAEMELLFLNHPLLLLQYLFTGGHPALLFPFVAILRAQGSSTYLCICSPWSADGIRSNGIAQQMAKQMEEKLIHAAAELRDSESRAIAASKGVTLVRSPNPP